MTTIDANDPRYEFVTGLDGKRKRIQRDGTTVTHPAYFMDSVERQYGGFRFADVRPARITALDGGTGVNSLNRPGFRVLGEMQETGSGDFLDAAAHVANNARQAVRDARKALYDEYDLQKSREYLTPTGSGEKQAIGSKPGDPCMCSNEFFPDDFASPGSMQKHSTLGLICVPNGRRVDEAKTYPTEAQDARRRRKQLRDPQGRESGTEEEVEETQNSTERAGFGSANVSHDSVRALQQRHAQIMDRLYAEDAQSLANRWRTP